MLLLNKAKLLLPLNDSLVTPNSKTNLETGYPPSTPSGLKIVSLFWHPCTSISELLTVNECLQNARLSLDPQCNGM